MVTKKGRPRIRGDIQQEIERLTFIGWGPAQIHKDLDRREEFAGDVPTLRTVQRIAAALSPRDPTGPWHWQDSDEPRPVLDVLAAILVHSRGTVRSFTQAEAELIAKVRLAAPDLSEMGVYHFAKYYQARRAAGADTTELDLYLALTPWRGEAWSRLHEYAQRLGWIPSPPHALTTMALMFFAQHMLYPDEGLADLLEKEINQEGDQQDG